MRIHISRTSRQIWQIAFPAMVGGLGYNIVSMTDVAFLGRVGEVEVGACGLASIWYLTFLTLGMGLGTGTQVLVARRSGEDDDEGIGLVTDQALFLGFGISFALFFLFYFLSGPLLTFFVKSEEIHAAATTYIQIRAFDVGFVMLSYILRGFYNGLGKNNIIIWGTVAMALINFVLNYVLILGHFGFPKLGIAGSAIASVIAQFFYFLILFLEIYRLKYHKKFKILQKSKFEPETAYSIANLSGPTALQYLISLGSFFFFILVVEKLGARVLAVSEIVKTVYVLFMIPTWGFATAASTIVSNLIGQQKQKQVPLALRKTVIVSMSFSFVLILLLMAFPEMIFGIYTNDITLIKDSVAFLWIVVIALFIYGASSVLLQGVIGMGATRYAFLTEVTSITLYAVYISVASFMFSASLETLWLAELIYVIAPILFSVHYIKYGAWRKIDI